MIESGQPPIEPIAFASRLDPRLPVEVIDWPSRLGQMGSVVPSTPERLTFHLLVLIASDAGHHTVDFSDIQAKPGRLIQIRPGQVQAWDPTVELDATLVLSKPAVVDPGPWFPGDPAWVDLDDIAVANLKRLIEVTWSEQARFDGSAAAVLLLTRLFEAMASLFDLASQGTGDTRFPPAYLAFRQAIEADLAWSHDVVDHAERLGFSARTIDRACKQVTGQTAKQLLTDRLLLEAKRLLVHSDRSAASIAASLGFSEPTNFSRFFTRLAGVTPMEFRHGP